MSDAGTAVHVRIDRLSPRFKHAFALTLWYALNLLVLLALFGYGLPDFANGVVTHRSASEVFAIFSRKLAPWLPASLPAAMLVSTAALTGLLWLLSSLYIVVLDRLSLRDTSHHAWSSIGWSVRNYFGSGILWLSFAPLAIFAFAARLLPDSGWVLFGALTAICALAMFIVPALTLNPDCLGGSRSGRMSNLRWPGLANSLLFLGVWLVSIAIDVLVLDWPSAHWAYVAIAEIGLYPVMAIVSGAVLGIVIARDPLAQWGRELKRRANLRFVAAWIILDVHWLVVAAWIVAPLLVGQVLLVYVAPQYLYTLKQAGQQPGALFGLARFVAEGVSAYWLVIMWPIQTMLNMTSGRFLLKIDAEPSARSP